HVNRLYNVHRGQDRLKTTVEGPTFDTSKEGTGVPVLDVVASRSADGSALYLKMVNTAASRPRDTRSGRRGVAVQAAADWHLLAADSLDTHNSFGAPEAVRPRQEALTAASRLQVSLPPPSVFRVVSTSESGVTRA